MKKQVLALLLALGCLLSACASPAAEPEAPAESAPPESCEVEPRLPWPLRFTDAAQPLPDLPLGTVAPDEPVGDWNALAEAVDAVCYLSPELEDPMWFYTLTDDLRDQAAEDPVNLLAHALQIAPLGHNFLYSYNDSALDQNLFGISAPLTEDYATVRQGQRDSAPVMHYEFYKNSLNETARPLTLQELPLGEEAREALPVSNSEQLYYAVTHGFLPLCESGSDAEKILSRSVEALAAITRESMTERELYKAIYQYVILSNQYDYSTLLDGSSQNRVNRSLFLEGAVLDNLAVCDGLSKQIVLLCSLMGLDARHVGARDEEQGHAYVYADVEGDWYLSCPTYGSNRCPMPDESWQDYHTMNYLMTDFDTNMAGWPYDSEAYPEVEAQLRQTETWDYWSETYVHVNGELYNLHPDKVEEALVLLRDAAAVQRLLGMPVELELCGSVDVLKTAYEQFKTEEEDLLYLSGGSFEGQRLQVYVIGAAA